MSKEEKFYSALKDIFVGAKIEGESGYINLMKIKSRYYKEGVFPKLQKDIEEALKPFQGFREELFDKLYTFFNRYFSESGSIYFRYTPIHQNVYEKIYTDDKDVMLFWKTHPLYYVKTDRLFKNMEVEIDGIKFFFDVSNLEHKKAFEKREIIYEFKEKRNDGVIVFSVSYSERGKKTKIDEILKALKKEGVTITEDILEKAFRVFEKQSEVDYFINKNAKEFLREQFNMWLYQYVFSGESEWTEERIKQLQVLKDIAFKIIDFISQFEDELVKIWNKPKFVLNSNYVITLDRIAKQNGGIEVIERLLNHPKFNKQLEEWKELGIVDDTFDRNKILENKLTGKQLNLKYQFLPIDTKYFKDLEFEILSLFDDLDKSLDGWLIKSENYQALNTILPKFKERVQTIYIDPPFNKEQDADYFYSVKYKESSWITLLENRLQLAKEILKDTGSIFVRCDYNGNMYVRLLMNEIFGEENFRNEIVVKRGAPKAGLFLQFENLKSIGVMYDNLYWYSKIKEKVLGKFIATLPEERKGYWTSFKKIYDRPTMRYELLGISLEKGQWMWSKERALKAVENYRNYLDISKQTRETIEEYSKRTGITEFVRRKGNTIQYWVLPKEEILLDNNWLDIPGYSSTWDFKTENSEILLKRVIASTSNEGDLVMDFFLGSGTTTAVAHKLKRKWIGVEMGEHFYRYETPKGPSGVLVRMKEVLAGGGNHEPCGISKEKGVNWSGGGFFKYYELEQYEDTLRKVKYEDSDFFENPYEDPYNQYVFM
ncbi:MAG: site-specific DNA-methyltransferase, partial [Nitrososphaeria archaeon]|nr:site-specific DNA-methyltransferase [Nitrososphaeria archaeon]